MKDVYAKPETILKVKGASTLSGNVSVAGSKNAFQKLIAASILIPGIHTLRRVPTSQDAASLIEIAQILNAEVHWEKEERTLHLDTRRVTPEALLSTVTTQSTGSFLFAGALLARFNEVLIGPPGGDKIGARPVDRHLAAFRSLGAEIDDRGGAYRIRATVLRSGTVKFEHDTVNGTANTIMAAIGAAGITHIHGASIDPDVLSLVQFLRRARYRVDIKKDHIVVHGTSSSIPAHVDFTVPADRNDAATLVIAGALLGDHLSINDLDPRSVVPLIRSLRAANVPVEESASSIIVSRASPRAARPIEIETSPYPGFSTDWGPMVQVLMSQLPGVSYFHERIYSGRFGHLKELERMNLSVAFGHSARAQAKYTFEERSQYGQAAWIFGPCKLYGQKVHGENLRATAALLLAGLVAEGTTLVYGADHITRGYDELVPRLVSVGADCEFTGSATP